jgi:hypothetical protein
MWTEVLLPKLVLNNQVDRLITSIKETMLKVVLQLYEWHAVASFKKSIFNGKEYTKEHQNKLSGLI